MRRRDFTIGLLLAAGVPRVWAQKGAAQHRVAIVRPAGPVTVISATGIRFYQAFFAELRRLGDVEGQNLSVERYSGEGRPDGFADLARAVVNRKPDVIVAISGEIAQAIRAANDAIPIVLIGGGDLVRAGLVTSLARPGGNLTGVTVNEGNEIFGKRLQILKEAIPSVSRVAYLDLRTYWDGDAPSLLKQSGQLHISLIPMLLGESTPSAYQRVFSETAHDLPDAITVSNRADLTAYDQLVVDLVNRSGLPAIYPVLDYVEVGGLMAYASDLCELAQRTATDVHEILGGTKPGEIPIYQPTKYELVINLKAAKRLGLTIPPTLLATADEVIE